MAPSTTSSLLSSSGSTPSASTHPPGGKRYDTFGAGDAAADLARSDMEDIFVETRAINSFLENEPAYQFVAGAKGAGKSLALFKKVLHVRALSGVLVLPRRSLKAFIPGPDFGGNGHWSEFWQLWDGDRPRLDAWATLWEWALLRTVLGSWLDHARSHADYDLVSMDELELLTEDQEDADPFDLVSGLLQQAAGGQHTHSGRFVLPDVRKLRKFMTAECGRFPPTYLFLDNYDDSFEADPDFWKASCLGAYRAIRSLHERSNRRLHCYLTLRPEVIYELMRSEHSNRYLAEICQLRWEDKDLLRLFAARAARLKPQYLRDPAASGSDPVAALLGQQQPDPAHPGSSIRNLRLEIDQPLYESTASYMLRHTLRRPRDLILLGNEIVKELSRLDTADASDADKFRVATDRAAQLIGRGYLAEIKHRWPWDKLPGASLDDFLKTYLRTNVLHHSEAYQIEREFAASIGLDPNKVHPFSELAQMGLLGYSKPGAVGLVQHFVSVGETSMEAIPRNAEWYFVHPVLYGDPLDLDLTKGLVVGPGLPVDPRRLPPPRGALTVLKRSSAAERDHAFSWIHVSDVHFGAGKQTHKADLKQVAEAVITDARRAAPKGLGRLLVTGDVAFSAQRRQYDEASVWLGRLTEAVGISRAAVRVIPGNHDVDRKAAQQVNTEALHSQARLRSHLLDDYMHDTGSRRQLLKKLAEFDRFARGFPGERLSNGLDWTEVVPLGTGRLRLIGLSTVWVSDERDGRGPSSDGADGAFVPNMRLGKSTLQEALQEMGPDELPLLLTHHPREWLADECRGWLDEALGSRPWLHLSGHVHRPEALSVSGFGQTCRAVRMTAGATHGDPADERVFGYSWGALAWHRGEQRWEIGWAPRMLVRGEMRADRNSYELDEAGFAWRPLEVAWAPPDHRPLASPQTLVGGGV